MTRALKNIAMILVLALLIGASASLLKDVVDINWGDNKDHISDDLSGSSPIVNTIGGIQGFYTDFSDAKLVNETSYMKKIYTLSDGGDWVKHSSSLYYEPGCGDIYIDSYGELNYLCTQSGFSSTAPKFKFSPDDDKQLFLDQFRVLTVDFDIVYRVDEERADKFKALFNVRSNSTNSSVTDGDSYYCFPDLLNGTGRGHYTFVFNNSKDENMEILVYKDGILVNAISNFLQREYDGSDMYVSCFNLELPFTQDDYVWVDNVQFYIFENDYKGPIIDLVDFNPDVNLKTCKDSVLYGG